MAHAGAGVDGSAEGDEERSRKVVGFHQPRTLARLPPDALHLRTRRPLPRSLTQKPSTCAM